MIWLKAGFVFGAIISGAVGVLPDLGVRRRRALSARKEVRLYLPAVQRGAVPGGAALAFFVVFQFVLEFLFKFNAAMGIDPDPRISEWLSFVIMMPLMFGISFQLPLVMLFLERIGDVHRPFVFEQMADRRAGDRRAGDDSFAGGDPMSMMFMFVPLVGLFFLGIWLCRYMRPDEGRIAAA